MEVNDELERALKEIERLHSIIKEVREYIEKLFYFSDEDDISHKISKDIKRILDKEDK